MRTTASTVARTDLPSALPMAAAAAGIGLGDLYAALVERASGRGN